VEEVSCGIESETSISKEVIVLCYFVIFETGSRDKDSLQSIARSKVLRKKILEENKGMPATFKQLFLSRL